MRLRTTAAAAATTALTAGAAVVAAGRRASGVALRPHPGRPAPDCPRLTVHAARDGHVTLTRTLASQRPGTYGLVAPGRHAVVGPVAEGVPRPADCVVRRLERVTHGALRPGTSVWLTPQVHLGNPRDALGLDHADVDIPGELGPLPAWFLPGDRATWVITVHGLGATREHPMVLMPFLRRHRFPVLDLAYRGDLGAPHPAGGVGHLGSGEWRDVESAIRYALRYGARDVVLHGWSTGAAMVLRAAAESRLRDRVSGVVLDSPVLDWRATLRALATAHGTPAALLPLAVRAAEGRTGLGAGGLDAVAAAGGPDLPTLIVHGPDDTLAPWDASRAYAARRPRTVALHTVRQAQHAAMWNADPEGYEEALRRFLTPLM
ncbi:hypothetical protein RKE29_24910 [Streptomyces sp. B1866]|uniref:alpha/beta hydrolase n=1 Tax=Streptomyces sp. B1866 TaxID=3075431 RepID=UPI00288CC2F4|nr:alpha/beta fold hydrolase [Streptomyces sp. B1866]MDT3399838.1 hypothetical protein [Streptomyces sp. B1866]